MIRTMIYDRDSGRSTIGDEKLLNQSSRSPSEWARGREAQMLFSLYDFRDITNPSVYLRNIASKLKSQGKGKWVFQNKVGNHIDMDNFRARVWYPMLEENGLRRVRIHDISYPNLNKIQTFPESS